MYSVCSYRLGHLVHESAFLSRSEAEFAALDSLREGCEVTIYRNGTAMKDWYRRIKALTARGHTPSSGKKVTYV